jgi:hypothetical protein
MWNPPRTDRIEEVMRYTAAAASSMGTVGTAARRRTIL